MDEEAVVSKEYYTWSPSEWGECSASCAYGMLRFIFQIQNILKNDANIGATCKCVSVNKMFDMFRY